MEFNKTYNRTEFLSFLRVNFLPEDFLLDISNVKNPQQFHYIQQVFRLGECESLDLVVYEVHHTSKHDARVGLTKDAFRFLADEYKERALVLFVPEDDNSNYRFSLIEITLEQAENSVKVTRGYSNPRRYSYYLGKGIACHTPNKYLKNGRVQDIEDLRKRFSVEVLSDEFFEEFDKLYSSAPYPNCEPGFIEEFEANPVMLDPFLDKTQEDLEKQKKPMRDYVKKLMGRLVFMQFLQKKGWLGVPAECEGWKDGNEHFLQDVFKTTNHQETFLDDVLEPIFFEYLNTPYELRKKKYFSIGGREYKIPYLNGGLFEQTELDHKPSRFSVGLFQRLFDLFDLYNFTVDENDPDDVQVSVDPEMLGRIFENQLEDNNDKGAFYTPKFIVQYMCRESLVAYLQTNVEDDFEKECIRYFVEAHDKEILTPYQQKDILAKLKSVTICDPAIGSGAFPVGLLKELFYCRQELEPIANAADTKKQIIQENIYGVDIERGAVDIARLRFWLSIVVDEDTPQALPNLDYKIVEGNSLITTFDGHYINLSTNDSDFRRSSLFKIRPEKKALQEEQKRFFTLSGEEKYRSEIAIKIHILNIIGYQLYYEKISWEKATIKEVGLFGVSGSRGRKKNRAQVEEFTQERQDVLNKCEELIQLFKDESKTLKERAHINIPFFEWGTVFSDIIENDEIKGFDIVIGNPPYIDSETMMKTMPTIRELYRNIYNTAKGNWDIYVLFFELGMNLLNKNGILSYITPNKWISIGYGKALRDYYYDNLFSICDCQNIKVFEAGNEPVISLFLKNKYENINVSRFEDNNDCQHIQSISKKRISKDNLGMCISEYFPILANLLHNDKTVGDYIDVENPFSTSEAYELLDILNDENSKDNYKLINTGTIDPYVNLWGSKVTSYLKSKYMYPSIDRKSFQLKFPKRVRQASASKIIITGMRYFECFYDYNGSCVAGKSTIILLNPKEEKYFKILLGILNSKLISFFIRGSYSTLGIDGGINFSRDMVEGLPLPSSIKSGGNQIISLVDKIIECKRINKSSDTSSIETEIDNIVYKLYGMKNEEIRIIENSFNKENG